MTEFRIAGSVADEETLAQVVRIAGYASNVHRLVSDHVASCPVHAKPLRATRRYHASAPCGRGCDTDVSRFHY